MSRHGIARVSGDAMRAMTTRDRVVRADEDDERVPFARAFGVS